MHLNLFTECTPSPSFEGLWRHPQEPDPAVYRSLGHWIALAARLEEACFDALFFADVHGVYDVYEGSWHPAVREAVQIPSIDPVLVIPALAAATRHLGFAVTYSTTYHPPYLCARTFSTLDHLTGGRIGWNVVTSYLRSAEANGIGEFLAHDVRYDRADEYLAAVRALWEDSWSDGAVVADVAGGRYADPALVRETGHDGKWFRVRGPHQCEPSPQRTPVLYQAGASGRGMAFAARHAEVVFLTAGDRKRCAEQVAELRRLVREAGRDPASVKVLLGIPVIVAPTAEEAAAKVELFTSLHSAEGRLAKWCGWTGVDLGGYPDDTPIESIRVEGTRTPLDLIRRTSPDRDWTVGDVRRTLTLPHRPMRGGRFMLAGTPEEVAAHMTAWIEQTGIDGFNLIPCPASAGAVDICDLLVPQLQRQDLFRRRYDPDEPTLRERYFGAGHRDHGGRP
nr:LLM class flavin-dependent oxidoreductase [Dactylosporangium thailandense]